MNCEHGVEIRIASGLPTSCPGCQAKRCGAASHLIHGDAGGLLCGAEPPPARRFAAYAPEQVTCPDCQRWLAALNQPIPQEKPMTTEAPLPQQPPPAPMPIRSLVTKLAEVMGEIHRVAKNGHNDFHKYDYATESDITAAVRGLMADRHLMLVPDVTDTKWREVPGRNGPQSICTLHVKFSVHDGDTGEVMEFNALGEGQDSLDKATYKAMTGAVKYALLKLFLIPTGNDPEDEQPEPKRQAKKATPAAEAKSPEQPAAAPKLAAVPSLSEEQKSTDKLLTRLAAAASLEELNKLMAWAKDKDRPVKVYGAFWEKLVLPAEASQRAKLQPLPPEQERAALQAVKEGLKTAPVAESRTAYDVLMESFDKVEASRDLRGLVATLSAMKRHQSAGDITNEDFAQLMARSAVVEAKLKASTP